MNRRTAWVCAAALWGIGIGCTAQAADLTSGAQPVLPAPAVTPAGQPPAGTLLMERNLTPLAATGQSSLQVRANVFESESVRAGPLIDLRPNRRHPESPVVAGRQDESAVQLGGFVGYLLADPSGAPPASIGFDLQVGSDPVLGSGHLTFQPGVDYSMALSPSWQLNTRLFSTYTPENAPLTSADGGSGLSVRNDTGNEPGFHDVGIGLGFGYSVSERWNIQTQARYQRSLDNEQKTQNDPSPHQFFGGVMIDYKF